MLQLIIALVDLDILNKFETVQIGCSHSLHFTIIKSTLPLHSRQTDSLITVTTSTPSAFIHHKIYQNVLKIGW